MAYDPTIWKDDPNHTTPINATNLNKMENELVYLDKMVNNSVEEFDALQDVIWQQGGISGGVEQSATNRIRTDFISVENYVYLKLIAESGYMFAANFYDSKKHYMYADSSWISGEKVYNDKTVAYCRVVLRKSDNSAIVVSESGNLEGILSFVSGKKEIDDIWNYIEPEKSYTALNNGTITNPNNANAVSTINFNCKYMDEVEFVPVRPNITGYYYMYGYFIYDRNMTVLYSLINARVDANKLTIKYQDAAFIRFYVVEYNGSAYNPLRKDTFGYNPYLLVTDRETLVQLVDDAFTEEDFLAKASWEMGAISGGVEEPATNRIRTDYIEIGYMKSFNIIINNNYYYALNYYSANKDYISASSAWQSEDVQVDYNSYPENTGFLRVVLRRSDAGTINISEKTNIKGIGKTIAKQGMEYLSKKGAVASNRDNYSDLLSQARFSPTSGAKFITLMHFSDIHGNLASMKKAMEIENIYSSKIDDMIHTGDVVVANWSDGLANWIASGCAEKVISVVGNHDSEENYVLGTAGKENVYNGMLKPYIGNWDVVQPSGVDTPSSGDYCACYYYKDYEDAEIRLIVLDTNWWDDYQKTWLGNVLDDALTNEYSVILACHTPRFVTGVVEANFCSYTEPIINEPAAYANIPNDWLDPVNDFMEGGGEVICMLSGHNHRDHFGYLTNYPNILCITADKASVARTIDTARITGESNENAYNIITFNKTDKWIKIVRIGAEVDGQMRGKHVFCYDYANRRIISQW